MTRYLHAGAAADSNFIVDGFQAMLPPAMRVLAAAAGACLLAVVFAASAGAGDGMRGVRQEGGYAGFLIGAGRLSSEIRDIDGFANWGNPGATLGYSAGGEVGGVVAGRRFALGGVDVRVEAEAIRGDLSARTDGLDPTCPDESAAARMRWAAAARVGVERRIGEVRAFALAGPAVARIVNSVTDIDYNEGCLGRVPKGNLHVDADDSFRSASTRLGWTLGIGIETEMAPRWLLRLDGAYFDFGKRSYRVNRSGDGSCGPGGPRAPCTYSIRNRMTALRVAILYRFER